jgi:hypothetical protein
MVKIAAKSGVCDWLTDQRVLLQREKKCHNTLWVSGRLHDALGHKDVLQHSAHWPDDEYNGDILTVGIVTGIFRLLTMRTRTHVDVKNGESSYSART